MKVPEPRRLPSGAWFIQLRLTAPDGKKVSVPVSAPTKKECIRQAELIKAEHRAGRRPASQLQSITLGDAIDAYIKVRTNTVSPSTLDGYLRIKHNRFAAAMNTPLSQLSDWQAVINSEAALCSGKTLKNAWGLVRAAISSAGMSPPKVTLPQVVSNSRPWLDFDEIIQFLKAVEGKPAELPSLLALHSLRRSELLALTWDGIDLERGCIIVKGAVVQNENHKFVERAENKNASSQRVIPFMIPRLRELLSSVPDKNGKLIRVSPHYVAQQINSVCAAAGLPLVGCHGLRHSFASLAHHVGMPEAECMRLGGWADSATMRNIYMHLSDYDVAHYANRMAQFYKSANENANE